MGDRNDATAEACGRLVKPSEVLEALMNDGTFDCLRSKATANLKNNEVLKQFTQSLVENSQTLNTPGAEGKTRRELFDSLRRELEGPVLDRCSKVAWELILSKDGLGKEVRDSVDAIYNKLSSQAEPVSVIQAAEEVRDPSHEMENRTPSQEKIPNPLAENATKSSGYYSLPEGRDGYSHRREDGYSSHRRDDGYSNRREDGYSRDRDYRSGSMESERSRDMDYHERPRIRDRDVYERRDFSKRPRY